MTKMLKCYYFAYILNLFRFLFKIYQLFVIFYDLKANKNFLSILYYKECKT